MSGYAWATDQLRPLLMKPGGEGERSFQYHCGFLAARRIRPAINNVPMAAAPPARAIPMYPSVICVYSFAVVQLKQDVSGWFPIGVNGWRVGTGLTTSHGVIDKCPETLSL